MMSSFVNSMKYMYDIEIRRYRTEGATLIIPHFLSEKALTIVTQLL